jgi:hypothetical protein
MPPKLNWNGTAIERIESRLILRDSGYKNNCEEFSGVKQKDGYGAIKADRKQTLSHRYRWWYYNRRSEMSYQQFCASKTQVLHKCDNPPCCRIDHLFEGTQLDNMRDMIAKGRKVYAGPKGDRSANAKLTWEQARAIRKMVGSQRKIGALFGVSHSVVGNIKTNKGWVENETSV